MARLEALLQVHRGEDLAGAARARARGGARAPRPGRGGRRRDHGRAALLERDAPRGPAREARPRRPRRARVRRRRWWAAASTARPRRGTRRSGASSVALVERDDFGAGASWNSLKTIHGGMRYLQKLDLGRLRESARERRDAAARSRPSSCGRCPFLVPTYGHGATGREALALGLLLNDWLTRDRNRGLPPSAPHPGRAHRLRRRGAAPACPGSSRAGSPAPPLCHDAQAASTERLTLALRPRRGRRRRRLREPRRGRRASCAPGAGSPGSRCATRSPGATLEVRARVVLNAPGPWADDVLARGGLRPPRAPLLRARNLVLRRAPVRALRGRRTQRRPLPLPRAVGGAHDRRHVVRARRGAAERPAWRSSTRRAACLPLGRPRAAGRRPRPRGPRPRPRRRLGPLDTAAAARPRGRGRPPGPRQRAGRQVHDGAAGGRAGGRPRRPPARPRGAAVPHGRDAPRRGRGRSRARSRSARGRPCARRWR